MNKKVLILGAGLVAKPGVAYLLGRPGISVTVASRTVSKAEAMVAGSANGSARAINIEDRSQVAGLIAEHDIVISLLPWIHHLKVAELCLELRRHMVTTSYVSEGMKKLDREAQEKDLLFLNEIGVDPGIDHMTAMEIIDQVHRDGGRVEHFYSYCGGLPAPQHNDNPFGYKFSWSPRGVVLASRNPAQYLENGRVVKTEGRDLFLDCLQEEIEGLGRFEVYPNRDSLPYQELYGIPEALTVKRGTYRNIGWCGTFKKLVDLGYIDDNPKPELAGKTYRQIMTDLVGCDPQADLRAETAKKLGLAENDPVIERFAWLGLFAEEKASGTDTLLDVLSELLQRKLFFRDGEQDMIILRHHFVVANAAGKRETITSTLIDFGLPHGDTSMARTVSLPMAIATDLLANDKISRRGVLIPLYQDVYQPVLAELARLGIAMKEERRPLKD